MKSICEICGKRFDGQNADEDLFNHLQWHKEAIDGDPYTEVYKVLPPDIDDYAKVQLLDLRSGNYILDGEVTSIIHRTNIKDIQKLIGKTIKLTIETEVIE